MGINLTCKWGKFFDLYMSRHPRALKSLAKITDTKPVFFAQTRSLWPAVKCLSLLSGGGKGYFFSVVLGLQSFSASSAWNARKVNNSQPKPLTIRNVPAILMEHLIFCQPARFLWGTDKVRNRFVGCPCVLPFCQVLFYVSLNRPRRHCNSLAIQAEHFTPKLLTVVFLALLLCPIKAQFTFKSYTN